LARWRVERIVLRIGGVYPQGKYIPIKEMKYAMDIATMKESIRAVSFMVEKLSCHKPGAFKPKEHAKYGVDYHEFADGNSHRVKNELIRFVCHGVKVQV